MGGERWWAGKWAAKAWGRNVALSEMHFLGRRYQDFHFERGRNDEMKLPLGCRMQRNYDGRLEM